MASFIMPQQWRHACCMPLCVFNNANVDIRVRVSAQTEQRDTKLESRVDGCLFQNAVAERMSLVLMEMEIGDKRSSRNLFVEKQCLV